MAASGADHVRRWFAAAIGVPCRLVRQAAGAREARAGTAGLGRRAKGQQQQQLDQQQPQPGRQQEGGGGHSAGPGAGTAGTAAAAADQGPAATAATATAAPRALGFANDGQFLLVNAASVDDVNARIAAAACARAAGGAAGALPAAAAGEGPVELLRCAGGVLKGRSGEGPVGAAQVGTGLRRTACPCLPACFLPTKSCEVGHLNSRHGMARGRGGRALGLHTWLPCCWPAAGSGPTLWWEASRRTKRTAGRACRYAGTGDCTAAVAALGGQRIHRRCSRPLNPRSMCTMLPPLPKLQPQQHARA